MLLYATIYSEMLMLHQVTENAERQEMGHCRYPESDGLMLPVSPSTLNERDRGLKAVTLAHLGRGPNSKPAAVIPVPGGCFEEGLGPRYRALGSPLGVRADHEAGDRSRGVEMRRGSGPIPAASIPVPGGPALGSLESCRQSQWSGWKLIRSEC